MAEISRRKVIAIEVAVLLLWNVFPAIASGLLVHNSRRHLTFDASYDASFTITRLGSIAILGFILWNSGDAKATFGLCRIRPLRDILLGLLMATLPALPSIGARVLKTGDSIHIRALAEIQPIGVLLLAIISIFAAACFEELLFRGALIPRLEELLRNRWLAVIVAGLIFGSAHAYQGPQGMATAAAFGCMLGVVFVYTRSLWPTVIAHFGSLLLYLFIR